MGKIQKELYEIKELLLKASSEKKTVLTLEEAVLYLHVSKSCMYKMTRENKISHSKPNGKLIYFEKCDLDKWALKNKILSDEELSKSLNSDIS